MCGFQKLMFWFLKNGPFLCEAASSLLPGLSQKSSSAGATWEQLVPGEITEAVLETAPTGHGCQLTPASLGAQDHLRADTEGPTSSRGADRLQKVAIKWSCRDYRVILTIIK